MVRVLDQEAVRSVLDLEELLTVIDAAFRRQRDGAVERPPRPHYPVGIDLPDSAVEEPAGTGLVMPAYIHGESYFVTKLASVHDENPERGLPTTNAQVAMNDAVTGLPVAYMDGAYITAARTSAIGGLSARELTTGPVDIGVIGAGTQARWQVRAIDAAVDLDSVAIFDVDTGSMTAAVEELAAELDADVHSTEAARSAVVGADLVITATTSPEPVFPGDALEPGTVVVAIGAYTPEMQEIDSRTITRAARVFADVPEEVASIGDIAATDLSAEDLVPFHELLHGDAGRGDPEEILVIDSVGSAIMDAAAASYVYERAEKRGLGTDVDL